MNLILLVLQILLVMVSTRDVRPRLPMRQLQMCKACNRTCGWGEEPKARLMNILRGVRSTSKRLSSPPNSVAERQLFGDSRMRQDLRKIDEDQELDHKVGGTTLVRMELLDVRNRANVKAAYKVEVPTRHLKAFMRGDTWPAGVRFSLLSDEVKCNAHPVNHNYD